VSRAEQKAAKKFAKLPPNISGVASEVCFADGAVLEEIANNRHLLSDFPLAETERSFGQLLLLCGESGADGLLRSYTLADAKTDFLPSWPHSGR